MGGLIAHVKAQALAAQTHADLPFEQVVELLQPPRSLAHAPLFQVMFAWQNTPETAFALPGLAAQPLDTPHRVAKFDLLLNLAETAVWIEGGLEYATALFDRATAERWRGHWRVLLEALAAAADDTPLATLPLLGADERRRVLYDWNATEAAYPENQGVHQLFEEQAARNPEAVALIYEDQSLTYAELNARANRLARALVRHGVGRDQPVAIGLERSPELIVAVLGILKAGGACLPLDLSYPTERLTRILAFSEAHLLVATPDTAARLTLPDGMGVFIDWDGLAVEPEQPPNVPVSPEQLAYCLYTSGSTGQPKGVAMPHRALLNLVVWQLAQPGFDRPARTLQPRLSISRHRALG